LFLNGTRVAQRTTSLTPINEDVAIDRIRLGSNSTGNDTYHYGNIDEFIYIAGKDLTEVEMLLLYNNGKPDDIGDLPLAIKNVIRCWLRFGDGQIDGDTDKTSVIFDQKNATLNSDLITNGDFSTSGTPANTSFSLGWRSPDDSAEHTSIANGVATILNPTGSGGKFFATNGVDSSAVVVSGNTYKLTYTVTANDGCTSFRYHTGGAYVTTSGDVGTHTVYYVAAGVIFLFRNNTTGSTIKIDNVSLEQVNGNPGFCVADATVGNNNVP